MNHNENLVISFAEWYLFSCWKAKKTQIFPSVNFFFHVVKFTIWFVSVYVPLGCSIKESLRLILTFLMLDWWHLATKFLLQTSCLQVHCKEGTVVFQLEQCFFIALTEFSAVSKSVAGMSLRNNSGACWTYIIALDLESRLNSSLDLKYFIFFTQVYEKQIYLMAQVI